MAPKPGPVNRTISAGLVYSPFLRLPPLQVSPEVSPPDGGLVAQLLSWG
jgi:hypothetical protein